MGKENNALYLKNSIYSIDSTMLGDLFDEDTWTVQFYFQATSLSTRPTFISRYDSSSTDPRCGFFVNINSARVTFYRRILNSDYTTDWKILTGSTAIALSTWYHVTAISDHNAMYLFVNGALDASATFSEEYTKPAQSDVIGIGVFMQEGTPDPIETADVTMDELRIYANYGKCDATDPDAASCAALLPAIPGDTGGWRLVRHIPAGQTTWYTYSDNLAGTASATGGTLSSHMDSSPTTEWTKDFGTFTEYLLVQGNIWGRFYKSVFDAWCTDAQDNIGTRPDSLGFASTSDSPDSPSTELKNFCRVGLNDPIITLGSLTAADMLYAESSLAASYRQQTSAMVFVRDSTAAGAPASTLGTGLRVHFPFSSDVQDSSGNNFDITQESSGISPAFSGNYIFLGAASGASAFYGKLPNPTTVIPSEITTLSLSFWVDEIADSGGWKCLWRFEGDYIYYDSSQFYMKFQGKGVYQDSGAITTPQHITVTCDSDTYTYYINGVQTSYTTAGTSTFGTSGYAPTANIDFDFFHNNGGTKFVGKVKDFRIYDRVLSQSEIDELVAMGG